MSGIFNTGRAHGGIKAAALRSERRVAGMKTPNHHAEMYGLASLLAVQNSPIQSVSDYDAWLAAHLSGIDSRSRTKATGAKLRRAVQMIRNGCSCADANRVVGFNIRSWIALLPEGLRP